MKRGRSVLCQVGEQGKLTLPLLSKVLFCFSKCIYYFGVIWDESLRWQNVAIQLFFKKDLAHGVSRAAERDRSSLEVLTYEGFQFTRGTSTAAAKCLQLYYFRCVFTTKSERVCIYIIVLYYLTPNPFIVSEIAQFEFFNMGWQRIDSMQLDDAQSPTVYSTAD